MNAIVVVMINISNDFIRPVRFAYKRYFTALRAWEKPTIELCLVRNLLVVCYWQEMCAPIDKEENKLDITLQIASCVLWPVKTQDPLDID